MAVLLGAMLAVQCSVEGAEYFVNKKGDDAQNGRSRQSAFLTVQKGVDALKPGDTLTIGPGEYLENVQRADLGGPDADTVIRADIPGTAVLRGDRDAELDFRKVAGRRFVYVADCKGDVLSVHEVDTLMALAPAADAEALEFGPGRFVHDKAGRKLYVCSSDFRPPGRHCYAIGTLRGDGFLARNSRRITFEGLAARGFARPVTKPELCYPISGFMLRDCQRERRGASDAVPVTPLDHKSFHRCLLRRRMSTAPPGVAQARRGTRGTETPPTGPTCQTGPMPRRSRRGGAAEGRLGRSLALPGPRRGAGLSPFDIATASIVRGPLDKATRREYHRVVVLGRAANVSRAEG